MNAHDGDQVQVRDPWVGRVLDERYRVLRRIGKGGMGVVYLAEHLLLHKRVAIKTLPVEALGSQEAADRFLREAQAAAAVGNEHVVDVTDMGALEFGQLYFVLEYLEGSDLGRVVDSQGPMPVHRALQLLLQLCDAMEAVHAAGIVHRDLKPDNLFLLQRRGIDFLKVLDFGVCQVRDAARALTASGATLGTPNYMAPEQVQGARDVDGRVDVYGIGAVGYFLLVGDPPFEASSLPNLFLRICHDAPTPVGVRRPDVPPSMDAAIMRALHKDPGARFPDCGSLRAALLDARDAAATAPVWASVAPAPAVCKPAWTAAGRSPSDCARPQLDTASRHDIARHDIARVETMPARRQHGHQHVDLRVNRDAETATTIGQPTLGQAQAVTGATNTTGQTPVWLEAGARRRRALAVTGMAGLALAAWLTAMPSHRSNPPAPNAHRQAHAATPGRGDGTDDKSPKGSHLLAQDVASATDAPDTDRVTHGTPARQPHPKTAKPSAARAPARGPSADTKATRSERATPAPSNPNAASLPNRAQGPAERVGPAGSRLPTLARGTAPPMPSNEDEDADAPASTAPADTQPPSYRPSQRGLRSVF